MRPSLPALTDARVHRLMRIVLLALTVGVALGTSEQSALTYAAALAILGLLASRTRDHVWVLATTACEGLLVGLAVASTGWADSPYLPYLIAPAFTGGLAVGVVGGILPIGVTAAFLVLAPAVDPTTSVGEELSSDLVQWVVLPLLVAVVASWVRAVLREAESRQPDSRVAQEEAFRLLIELRNVARQLPGTLDPATTAESMLERTRSLAPCDAGAVLVAATGGRQLHAVARMGAPRTDWPLSLEADTPLAEAWHAQQPHTARITADREHGTGSSATALVVPLVSGRRTFGLVVLQAADASAFPPGTAELVREEIEQLVLPLQTGLAFDEVRELATAEERRRLSREIHDGIAQELASVAYALDTAVSDLEPEHPAGPQVSVIRDEVRRLLTELRMSLFDLRSEVGPDEGLGAALGRHVRAVGAASGLTVHLSLNEGPMRLAAETEAELLRIAQEAVANARRHAQARNLWVSCTVDPPTASLTVEDDGRGLDGRLSEDSHGLAIMRERAARVRGDLVVENRAPHGTRVQVTIGKVRS